MLNDFLHHLWQPPRTHGDVIEDRTVSFLELFYDLVYVVVVAATASTLAHHLSGSAVIEFVVVFGLIWLAWLNGTLYYDFHGREDIRTRFYTFAQMILLALLAVYVSDAVTGGLGFALTYAGFIALLMWLWYTVYRIDRREQIEDATEGARRYLTLLAITLVAMLGSAFLSGEIRLVVWGAVIVLWLVAISVMIWSGPNTNQRLAFLDSTVERFGLFTILVLGEVVVGVVEGLSEAHRDGVTIITAFFALIIGFGLWWNYFDRAGRRLPHEDMRGVIWIIAHLPLTMSIAAAGASMVNIIEHAADIQSPVVSTWLLTGAVALNLVSLAIISPTLQDYDRFKPIYRPMSFVMILAAGLSLLVGLWRPTPLVLVITLAALLSLVWIYGVWRWLVAEERANP